MQLVIAHKGPEVHLLRCPLQLFHLRLVLLVLLPLLLKAPALFFQIKAVVPAVKLSLPIGDFDAALCRGIQKPSVVADDQHGAAKAQQKILQPLHRVQVQVVGRLVQQQDFRILQDQARQVQPGFFPARQAFKALGAHVRADVQAVGHAVNCDLGLVAAEALKVGREPTVFLQQGRGAVGLHLPGQLFHPGADGIHMPKRMLQHGLRGPARGIHRKLRDQTDAFAGRDKNLALVIIQRPRENPEQRRLAAAVRSQNADPFAGLDLKAQPVQHIAPDFKGFDQ